MRDIIKGCVVHTNCNKIVKITVYTKDESGDFIEDKGLDFAGDTIFDLSVDEAVQQYWKPAHLSLKQRLNTTLIQEIEENE